MGMAIGWLKLVLRSFEARSLAGGASRRSAPSDLWAPRINSSCPSREFNRLYNRRIVVLRLVDPRRYRPQPHQLGGERPHQVARIGVVTKPACVVVRCEDQRHPVVNICHKGMSVGRDDGKGPDPLVTRRLLLVLPDARDAERLAIRHGNGVGLLRLLTLDRFPLEEPVHRYDAPAQPIRIPERWQ